MPKLSLRDYARAINETKRRVEYISQPCKTGNHNECDFCNDDCHDERGYN